MEQYLKPEMEIIILSSDVISTSCPNEGPIELPCMPGDY